MCPDKHTSTLGINGTQMSRFSRIQSSPLLSFGSENCSSGTPLCSGRTKLLEAVTWGGRRREKWKYFYSGQKVLQTQCDYEIRRLVLLLACRKQPLHCIVKPNTMQKEPPETQQDLTLGQDDLRTILLPLFLGIPRNQDMTKGACPLLSSLSQCRQASATNQPINELIIWSLRLSWDSYAIPGHNESSQVSLRKTILLTCQSCSPL